MGIYKCKAENRFGADEAVMFVYPVVVSYFLFFNHTSIAENEMLIDNFVLSCFLAGTGKLIASTRVYDCTTALRTVNSSNSAFRF